MIYKIYEYNLYYNQFFDKRKENINIYDNYDKYEKHWNMHIAKNYNYYNLGSQKKYFNRY